jgi:hypothetical protein
MDTPVNSLVDDLVGAHRNVADRSGLLGAAAVGRAHRIDGWSPIAVASADTA